MRESRNFVIIKRMEPDGLRSGVMLAFATGLAAAAAAMLPIPAAEAQGGPSPAAREIIQGLTGSERRQFFDLSRRERRAFIQKRMAGGAKPQRKPQPAIAGDLNPTLPREIQERAGLFNTGVTAVYPADAKCLEVKSLFGDQTRYDGSRRTPRFYQGYHEGFDISAAEGTALVALADGQVVHRYTGGRLVGNQIYLRHTPNDTGLSVFLYSKYKHFRELPALKVGDRVKMGQVIGHSGKTGTVGGHFGRQGYPHLHLSIYVAPTGEYKSTEIKVVPKNMHYFDPLALYLMAAQKVTDNHAVRALGAAAKTVRIPYKTTGGRIEPAGTRLIWPILCEGP